MDNVLPLVVAAIAAGAILLIFIGLASNPQVDPVQAGSNQLGNMQAKTLEELELQAPLLDRTLRPLGRACPAACRAWPAAPSPRPPRSAWPWLATPATCGSPTGWASRPLAPSSAAACSRCCSSSRACSVLGVPLNFVLIAVGLYLGYALPEFWLGGRVRGRQKAILLQIPDALDLLTISVRAGLGFDGALGKVVEKLKGPLTEEFRRALAEIRVGKPRRDALRDIVPRTEVQALTNFIGAIIQAEQLGVSISKVLQVQSEQLRIERRQRAEEMAAKAPIKMLFPLVGCIFPSLFIVILGPAIILIITGLSGSGV